MVLTAGSRIIETCVEPLLKDVAERGAVEVARWVEDDPGYGIIPNGAPLWHLYPNLMRMAREERNGEQ